MGKLTTEQSIYVDKLSHIVVNESSNMDQTTDDDDLKEFKQMRDLKIAVKRL